MQEKVRERVKDANRKRKIRRRLCAVVAVCSVLVAGSVFWQMTMSGSALSGDTYCGKEEHTHNDTCYENVLVCGREENAGSHTHTEECYTTVRTDELICGLEESAGHVHTDQCYTATLTCGQEEGVDGHTHTEACYTQELACGQEEGAGAHTHTDACYATEQVLTCGQEEGQGHVHTDACYESQRTCGMEEHTHSLACYSNPEAVETEEQWKADFADYTLTGEWGTDVAAIAETQTGYAESEDNYRVNEDGSTDGYTRYADWAGDDIYGDWDTYFVAFVLNYAGVPSDQFPVNAGNVDQWMTALDNSGYLAVGDNSDVQAGDLVIFSKENQDNAKQMGIISETDTDADGNITSITVIEGNCDDTVQKNTYRADDSHIVGYGLLGMAYEAYSGDGDKTDGNAEDTTDQQQTVTVTDSMRANVLDAGGADDGSGVVAQRITVSIEEKEKSEAKAGETLGVNVNATNSGANAEDSASIYIKIGQMPEGMSLSRFINNQRVVRADGSGGQEIILYLVEDENTGESYVKFDLPQGSTVYFDLDFETENGRMPTTTTLDIGVDTTKTTYAGAAWDSTMDSASEPVALTWTAEFDWNNVVKKVNSVDSNTIAYNHFDNKLSGILSYTLTATGNNHDDLGAIWTDHIEIVDTLTLEGGRMYFPSGAVLNESEGTIELSVNGAVVDIAWLQEEQNGDVTDMEWQLDAQGNKIGVIYTIKLDNSNLNSQMRDKEQTNLDLELRVDAQYLDLANNFESTLEDGKDVIQNHVDFTAVPIAQNVANEESQDEVRTTIVESQERGELKKTVDTDNESVKAGDTVAYTISFRNTGDTPIVVMDENKNYYAVTDTLPEFLYLTQNQITTLQAKEGVTIDTSDGKYTISWIPSKNDIGQNQSFELEFEATVKEDAGDTLDDRDTITNRAYYKTFTAEEKITFREGKIELKKTSNKSVVSNGDSVTYTITVSNKGGADVEEVQTFTDTLPDGLNFESAQIGNNENIKGTEDAAEYKADSVLGKNHTVGFSVADQTLTWTLDSLDAGDSISFSYTCKVDTDAMEGTESLRNLIVTGDDENGDEVVIGVDYPLELEKIVQQDTSEIYESGQVFDYTITLKNDKDHPSEETEFELVDILPENMIPYEYTLIREDTGEEIEWTEFVSGTFNTTFHAIINDENVKVSKRDRQIVLTWNINGPIDGSVSKKYRAQITLTEEQQETGEIVNFTNTASVGDLKDSVTVMGGQGSSLSISKNIYFYHPQYQGNDGPGHISEFLNNNSLVDQATLERTQEVSFTITGVDENGAPIIFDDGSDELTINYRDGNFNVGENTVYTIPERFEEGTYTIKENFPSMDTTGYYLDSAEYREEGNIVFRDYENSGITVTFEKNGEAKTVTMNNTYRPEGEASVDVQKSVYGIARVEEGGEVVPLTSKDEFAIETEAESYIISYYVSVINTGTQPVRIDKITDTLPEGMKCLGISSNPGDMFEPTTSIGDNNNFMQVWDPSGLKNMQTSDYYDKAGFELSSSNSARTITLETVASGGLGGSIQLEASETAQWILGFWMVCEVDPDSSGVREDEPLVNTVTVEVSGEDGTEVSYWNYEDIENVDTPYDANQNIGASEDKGAISGGGRKVSSSVSVTPTRQLVPGITKEAISYAPNTTDNYEENAILIGEDSQISAPDSIVKWQITLYNDGTLDLENYSLVDMVTAPYRLLTSTEANQAGIHDNLTFQRYRFTADGEDEPINDYSLNIEHLVVNQEGDGQSNSFTLDFGLNGIGEYLKIGTDEYAVLTFYTYADTATYKTYVNTATLYPEEAELESFNTVKVKDGHGELVYNAEEEPIGVRSSDIVSSMGEFGSRSWKEVVETENPENRAEGNTAGISNYIAVASPSVQVTYRNTIENTSSSAFQNLVIIDRLPAEGDRGVVNSWDERGSQFSVDFGGDLKVYRVPKDGDPVQLTFDQYTVSYSETPVDSSYGEADFNGETTGWDESLGENHTSFRIVMDSNFTLQSGEKLIVEYTGDISDQANPEEIAWNSFGYRYRVNNTVLTAEPPKVGVMVERAYEYELPETGGIGTTGFIAGGTVLMLTSCVIGGYHMRRRRERRGRS